MKNLILAILALNSLWVYEINQGVNLRKGPDNKKKVLTTVPEGETITVLEKTNQWWWKVEYKGTKGYIACSFISKSYPKTLIFITQQYPIQTGIALLIPILLVLRMKKSRKKKKK